MKEDMKKIFRKKLIWSVLSVLALAYACDDSFLDVAPTGQLDANLLSGTRGLDRSLIAVYSQVNGRDRSQMGSPLNWVWGSIRGGDATKGTDPGDFNDINPIQIYSALPNQGVLLDKYRASYEGVARANSTLQLLKTAAPEVPDTFKTRIEAQAKFLRAHFYFELKRIFNNTPYVDENTPATELTEVKNDADLWPKIEEDMLFAYTNLPETQTEVGRVNKWAAASYLAKIYMYQQKFDDAKTLFDEIITKGKTSNGKPYGLVPKYADIFKAANDNHEESVWAYQAAAGTGHVNNANPEMVLNWPYTSAGAPGLCCGFFQPSFEMANSYRTNGGLPLLDGSYNVGANQLKTDMGLNTADAFTPDAGPVDPRLDHTVGRRGIPYLDWGVMPGKNWVRNQDNGGPYAPKKYAYYQSDIGSLQDNSSWTPGYTAINYTIIRFADVLLMAAEAEIEAAAGDPEKARQYVNRVRARAANPQGFVMNGANPAANYDIEEYPGPWAKDDAAREKIRFERKLELSSEGHRFFDLLRWGIAKETIDAYLQYEVPKYPLGALYGSNFEAGKDEYLPIPQAEIDLVGPDVLVQNPNY